MCISFIAYAKKYLRSGWLRGVRHWPYLYCFQYLYFLTKREKKIQHSNSVAEKYKCIH